MPASEAVRARETKTDTSHPPRIPQSPRCTILSALHGVCILLLITKASEEFKFKFEFQFQFEFHFFSFRFLSLGLFLSSLLFLFRFVWSATPQENNKTECQKAKRNRKRKVAKNVCGHFTSLKKWRRKIRTAIRETNHRQSSQRGILHI